MTWNLTTVRDGDYLILRLTLHTATPPGVATLHMPFLTALSGQGNLTWWSDVMPSPYREGDNFGDFNTAVWFWPLKLHEPVY